MSFFEFLRCAQNDRYACCALDNIAVMLSVAKHLFPMVCIEILRFAQNDRLADCVISNEREISLLPLFEILRCAQNDKYACLEIPPLCVRDDIAVMLSVAKHLFPMVLY